MNKPAQKLTGVTLEEWSRTDYGTPTELLYGQVLPRECDSWDDIQAMTTSYRHTRICTHILVQLFEKLRHSSCQAHQAGPYVPIDHPDAPLGFIPDLFIDCTPEAEIDEESDVIHPCVVIEVVSPGSRARDYDDKFNGYLSCDFIEHYLIIDILKDKLIHHSKHQPAQFYSADSDAILKLYPPDIELAVRSLFDYQTR